MQIIRENDIASHVVEVDDDGDVRHARAAFFGDDGTSDDPAMIRYWNTRHGVVVQSMHSDDRFRGRDMMKWLTTKYGPVHVVEAVWEAWDFWDKMKDEGMVITISGADEPGSRKMEKLAKPFTLPLSASLNENFRDQIKKRYDSKPSFMIPYEDPRDGPGEFPVWINPSKNTFWKIMENCHGDSRGVIIDSDQPHLGLKEGDILTWDQMNLYHCDVYKYLKLTGCFETCYFFSDAVYINGDTEEPVPYEHQNLDMIQRSVSRYYDDSVDIMLDRGV